MIKGSALGPGQLARAKWRKSSHRAVRDSKNPTGPALTITPTEWTAFTAAVRAGEFG